MKFHHIGIACADIIHMKQYLERLFAVSEVGEEIFDEFQDVNLCMVTLQDGTRIELVSGKTVEKLVKRHHFLYHICYSTENMEMRIKEFENSGAKIVSPPKPAKLFGGGYKATFLMTECGLVEIIGKEGKYDEPGE